MTNLPPGWWVKNNEGSFSGPPPIEEPDEQDDEDDIIDDRGGNESDSAPEEEMGLDIRPDSPGWEDMEADTEDLKIQCLLCADQFPSSQVMLEHCRAGHGFDFVNVVKQHRLDFYSTIKYINLIRSRVQQGQSQPAEFDPRSIASEELAKPVLENDALLFTLDDVLNFEEDSVSYDANGTAANSND